MEYSYSFDDDLQQSWEWSEVMSPQAEILDYARHVAERFDLRRDIRFETKVVGARFDEGDNRWTVTTDQGWSVTARFCIMATGCLSVSNLPDIEGRDSFEGRALHTGNWPKEPVDLSGLRVGVIGTGSSGVQAIPVIAAEAEHVHVFQRSPVYTFPANNRPLPEEVMTAYKENYDEVRERQRHSVAGFSGFTPRKAPGKSTADQAATKSAKTADGAKPVRPRPKGLLDLTPEERKAAVDKYGPGVFLRYRDVYRDPEANEVACDLYRDRIDELVADPDVADGLKPKNHPLGCKRQVYDTDYYETFNRSNVTLVDLSRNPLVRITEDGVLTDEGEIELDVLVFATGFDAMTGALDRIDIRGRDDRSLRAEWAEGPHTYLGLAIEGFPNLFTITGPGSPSVLSNVIVSIEQHVEWITACIGHLDSSGRGRIEATSEAQSDWDREVAQAADGTMYTAPGCASWYLGANIEGKTQVFMPYVGGVGTYRSICDDVAADDYRGFILS